MGCLNTSRRVETNRTITILIGEIHPRWRYNAKFSIVYFALKWRKDSPRLLLVKVILFLHTSAKR